MLSELAHDIQRVAVRIQDDVQRCEHGLLGHWRRLLAAFASLCTVLPIHTNQFDVLLLDEGEELILLDEERGVEAADGGLAMLEARPTDRRDGVICANASR